MTPEEDGLAPAPARELDAEQQRWRERMLQGLLWAGFSALTFAAAWFLIVPHDAPLMTRALVVCATVLGIVTLAKRLPFTVRAWTLLLVIHFGASTGIAVSGFTPNAFIGYGTIVVCATLLFGQTAGLLTVAAAAATVFMLSLGHRSGVITRMPNWPAILDSTRPANILRVTGIFSLLMATSVIGISYLLKRSHELLLQKALAGSMAHDFNNALVVIWSAIDELSHMPRLPADAASPISALRQAANQATATARGLRAFGPLSPRRAVQLELSPVIDKAKTMLSRVLPPNIAIESDVRLDTLVLADEGELLRVLTNLVLNGRDAMRDGGRLTLRVRKAGTTELRDRAPDVPLVAIEVEDTGSGMSEEVKERLFEPFFTTKEGGGTGLGLASVREVVEAQGGRVTVKSQLGKGTTVTMLWPVALASDEHQLSRTSVRSGKGFTVLVVDDDPKVLTVLSKSLARADFVVLEATDAASALLVARRQKQPIHVLCTDCLMPGIPVRQLIEGYRELHRGRVLVCSGYAPAETGISLETVDDFLAKPFVGDDLVQRVLALAATARS